MSDSLSGAIFWKHTTHEAWDLAGFRAKYGAWPRFNASGLARVVEMGETSQQESALIRVVGLDGQPIAGYALVYVWPTDHVNTTTNDDGVASGPAPYSTAFYLPFGDGSVRPQLGPYTWRAADGSWDIVGIGSPQSNHDLPFPTVMVGGSTPAPQPQPQPGPEPGPTPAPEPGPALPADVYADVMNQLNAASRALARVQEILVPFGPGAGR